MKREGFCLKIVNIPVGSGFSLNFTSLCASYHAQDGSWADSPCETKLGYVCKRKPLAEEPGEAEVTYPGCQKVSVKQSSERWLQHTFTSTMASVTEVNCCGSSWWSPRKLLILYVLIFLRLIGIFIYLIKT